MSSFEPIIIDSDTDIDSDDSSSVCDTPVLSPSEELRFSRRFRRIYEWARTLHQPIPFWQQMVAGPDHLGATFWEETFRDGLPEQVLKLLARLETPTLDELLECGWIEEQCMGVYCKIAVAGEGTGLPNVLYVGYSCATAINDYEWGVQGRMRQHLGDWRRSEG